jgi:hypothetical protein
MVRLSEAERELLDSAFKRAKERQAMSRRTIDETGKDVPANKGRAVVEVLCLRDCPVMGRVAEWVRYAAIIPSGWIATIHTRTRIILDNES